VLLGPLVVVASPGRLGGEEMDGGTAEADAQAKVEVSLRLVEGVPVDGLAGGVEVVLRPEKSSPDPGPQENEDQQGECQAGSSQQAPECLKQPAHLLSSFRLAVSITG
jgi:hypothetical protein